MSVIEFEFILKTVEYKLKIYIFSIAVLGPLLSKGKNNCLTFKDGKLNIILSINYHMSLITVQIANPERFELNYVKNERIFILYSY